MSSSSNSSNDFITDKYLSWGRIPKVSQEIRYLEWLSDAKFPKSEKSILARGLGRSYGDSCLNENGILLSTELYRRFLDFDEKTGVIRCTAGITLEDILDVALPKGWFLPVSPGTKFVTVGGAIANDVHGKNHHVAGTFGCYVKKMALLRSDNKIYEISPNKEIELYKATIGGLGLTGIILWADIQLVSVKSGFFDGEFIKFSSLDEFFEINKESGKKFDYTVSWLDCASQGENFGRGIYMRANHSQKDFSELPKDPIKLPLIVPFNFPSWTLNNFTVKAFNFAYYNKQFSKFVKKTVHYDPFFYPLDVVKDWNKIYGKNGFYQYQCVVPRDDNDKAIKEVFKTIVESRSASFLAVLKEFGEVKSPGMLSFPAPGITLCLDFINLGEKTVKLLQTLEDLVKGFNGKMYPSKDTCMRGSSFRAFYPNLNEFKKYIDPKPSSSFCRRMNNS